MQFYVNVLFLTDFWYIFKNTVKIRKITEKDTENKEITCFYFVYFWCLSCRKISIRQITDKNCKTTNLREQIYKKMFIFYFLQCSKY